MHATRKVHSMAEPMTKDRVLRGALALADEIGFEAFTMRRLATALGTKPMTIYHHVPSKEEILDGIVELVFAEIALPPTRDDWRAAVRARYVSAREVLARHPWAPPYMESRPVPGPAQLRHHDAVLGALRSGLSLEVTAHAYAILDAYLYGFAMQEANLPHHGEEPIAEMAGEMAAAFPADRYPHFVELAGHVATTPGYRFGDTFDLGLDLLLDAVERLEREERADA
ncbi:TetR/AcrR family transcriptional regulator C-terminal domain-containing protein [Actinotalea sp. M2MS4P-6]|uniref:TetR/AcrR family transcriptional regulator n=1 Tax=Actinotalea sp. M2MS4P-6 TaxID=2983762 RepID=UPI0021E41B50|nr:TetR/AcrR family transcriptional regulator C-terminal domain-containing protein [Actinotalea sp. M2MS4P-6]MCV2393105.1 TetR/AcrR family transcriptional regulator C-terminal domain-containing protein [Actinotalea sp. M2MS4P-6]